MMRKTAFALMILLVQACSSLPDNDQSTTQDSLNSNVFEFTFIKESSHPSDNETHCLYLLSDESRLLLKFNLRNRSFEEFLSLGGLSQPEGFTFLANNKALVVSEPFHGRVVHLQK